MLRAEGEGQRGFPAGTRAGPGATQPVPLPEPAAEIGSARLLQGRRELRPLLRSHLREGVLGA